MVVGEPGTTAMRTRPATPPAPAPYGRRTPAGDPTTTQHDPQ